MKAGTFSYINGEIFCVETDYDTYEDVPYDPVFDLGADFSRWEEEHTRFLIKNYAPKNEEGL